MDCGEEGHDYIEHLREVPGWKGRHLDAMRHPRGDMENGVVMFMQAVSVLTEAVGTYPDAVSTPAFGDMLAGFRTLLNFELGRMDGGTLDAWACGTADYVRWDLDTETIVWDKADVV